MFKLLDIHKAFLVYNNFRGHDVQMESNYKIIVKTLLEIFDCPYKALLVFDFVKSLFLLLNDM